MTDVPNPAPEDPTDPETPFDPIPHDPQEPPAGPGVFDPGAIPGDGEVADPLSPGEEIAAGGPGAVEPNEPA